MYYYHLYAKKGKVKYTYKIIKEESGVKVSKETIDKEIIIKHVKINSYIKSLHV